MSKFTPRRMKIDLADIAIMVACILAILAGMELSSAYASAGESVDYARETLDCVAAVEDSTPLFRGAELDLGEDPQEDAKIEAALVEAGYYRDDVPLPHELQDVLQTACVEFAVPYEIMLALIEGETQLTWVDGDGGDSIGYCQIQPKWWQWLADEIGADIHDPAGNLRTGCAIVAYLREFYGSLEAGLAGYNPGDSTYVERLMERAEKWTLS